MQSLQTSNGLSVTFSLFLSFIPTVRVLLLEPAQDMVLNLSGESLDHLFGDHGTAQLFQCSMHKHVMCLVWAN
jgi:hypothetical protein